MADSKDARPLPPTQDDEASASRNMKSNLSSRILRALSTFFLDSKALKTFVTNFLLVYNIRAGVALLLRIVRLITSNPRSLLKFESLLGESSLHFRVEAVRMGLFLGSFTGLYRGVTHSLQTTDHDGKRRRWHSAAGGWLAGLALYAMDASWHRTMALYMATRAAQVAYNAAKARGYWHFWGSHWAHGDSLLFILSSGSIMYAYVMRPETLPPSYYRFIVRQGPIAEVMLQAVRDANRGRRVAMEAVKSYIMENGGEAAWKASAPFLELNGNGPGAPAMIPSRALHPYTASKALHSFNAFKRVAKLIFPVYLSLALVPAAVLRFKTFARAPMGVLGRSLLSAARSTVFLATFCSGYQAVICVQRAVLESRYGAAGARDHKLWYWLAGILSGFSILIERKSRRAELALYAFPRAADSLYMILYDHKLAVAVPQGEAVLFCSAMAAVMWAYDNEPAALSPLVAKLLERFLPRRPAYARMASDSDDQSLSTQQHAGAAAHPPPPSSSSPAARISSVESEDDSGYGNGADSTVDEGKGSTLSLSGGYPFTP